MSSIREFISREPQVVLALIELIVAVAAVAGFDVDAGQLVAILGATGLIGVPLSRAKTTPVE